MGRIYRRHFIFIIMILKIFLSFHSLSGIATIIHPTDRILFSRTFLCLPARSHGMREIFSHVCVSRDRLKILTGLVGFETRWWVDDGGG